MSKVEKVGFENAMNLTGFGKYNVLSFLLSSCIIVGMAFETFSVAYLVPASACELDTTSNQQGLMAAIPLIGIIVTSHLAGYLADTHGRRKVLSYSMALGFLTGGLSALSPDWITFSALKFLSSSALSGAMALSLTLLSEMTPEAKRSFLIVLLSSVILSSNGVMAIISLPVLSFKFSYYLPYLNIHFNSWRLLTLIFSAPCALCAIVLPFAHESPKYLLNVGEDEKALKVLRAIYVINKKKNADDYPVNSIVLNEESGSQVPKGFISSVVHQATPLFKPPLLGKTLLLSAVFVVVYICVHPNIVWLPYMVDGFLSSVQRGDTDMTFCERLRSSQKNAMEDEINDCSLNEFALTTVFSVGMLLCFINIILSGVINYFGRKKMFLIIQFTAGLAAICLNFSTSWYLSGVILFIFITEILNFGLLSSLSLDVFPTYIKAMGMCFTLMIGRGSAVLGINVLKMLLDQYCEASFYIFGSITIFGGILGFILPIEAKQPTTKCVET